LSNAAKALILLLLLILAGYLLFDEDSAEYAPYLISFSNAFIMAPHKH